MGKFRLLAVSVLVLSSLYSVAQSAEEKKKPEWYENGTVFGTVFANFNMSTDDTDAKAIAVERAYFGYKTKIDDHWSAAVKVDVGTPDTDDSINMKRYMFLKDAYLQYKIGDLTIKAGMAGAFQFKLSEKYWGHRYIYKAYQDASKMGHSADIGVYASYKPSDMLTVDYAIMNGEGYSKVQGDSVFKHAVGVTVNPIDILKIRAYADVYDMADSARQITTSLLAGVKTDKFSFAAEYDMQLNHKNNYDEDLMGFSFSTNYRINDQFNVLGRYDYLSSNEIDDDDDPATEKVAWNKSRDGSFIIAGFEYIPNKNINLAADYQHKVQADSDKDDVGMLFVHLQVKF